MAIQYADFWSILDTDIRDEVMRVTTGLSAKRGEFIYREGDDPKGIYLVEDGLLGLVLIGPKSGKEHLVRFFRPGQIFGHRSLFAGEKYHGSTQVLADSRLAFVNRVAAERLAEAYPRLQRLVIEILAKELGRCETQGLMILENQILPRVANSLIYLKGLHPDYPWTRQEIANFCGSTVSTVIKAMAELEKSGFIRQDGRAIEIMDPESLHRLSDEA